MKTETNNLSEESGVCWWRKNEDDRWTIVEVLDVYAYKVNDVTEYTVNELGGQWQRCIRPDELATLRAKAEAYDKGQEAWVVKDTENSEVIAASSISSRDAVMKAWHALGDPRETGQCPGGYTCRKVKIVEVGE